MFYFLNNFLDRSAKFSTPDIRNNAIGTKIIASGHNRYVGRKRGGIKRRNFQITIISRSGI